MMDAFLSIAALGVAVLGGVFLTFSDFVMRGLGQASGPAGMEAMQQINRTVYRSIFMVLFFGYAGLSVALIFWGLSTGVLSVAFGGIAYLLGTMAVTIFGNVPMNKRLDRAEGGLPYWDHYTVRWTFLNHLRSASCLLAAAGFMTGALAIAA